MSRDEDLAWEAPTTWGQSTVVGGFLICMGLAAQLRHTRQRSSVLFLVKLRILMDLVVCFLETRAHNETETIVPERKMWLKYKNSTYTNYANIVIAFVSNTRRRSQSDKNSYLRSLSQTAARALCWCVSHALDEAENPTCVLSLRAGWKWKHH